jgi:2-polyprenyl-6-methoxyphenol hydroxylase-like FAD-dependent oxidoreductase
MNPTSLPLIVGAGPVGLAAALFLAKQGIATRLIELRLERENQSRALAVNPRSLDLLEAVGITEQMLVCGQKIRRVELVLVGRTKLTIDIEGIHPRYPFMLALSQAATERLLAEELKKTGGSIQRGNKLVECRNLADGQVEAVIESVESGTRETVRVPWLLAADGAHSVAREQLGIEFVGSAFHPEWYLADAPLSSELAVDQAHVFLYDDNTFLFMLPVLDGLPRESGQDQLWRVIANRSDPLSHIVDSRQTGPTVWSSSFRIPHRINATLAKGNVYFAGDAAHVHSPLGARGMNLGIEDAWVFAELVRTGRLGEYNALRHPVDEQVVKRVEFLTRIVSADSWLSRFVRTHVFPLGLRLGPLRRRLLQTVSGLDHEVQLGTDKH